MEKRTPTIFVGEPTGEAPNVDDGLAEAYANRGDREPATRSQERSLQLGPGNFGAAAAPGRLRAHESP